MSWQEWADAQAGAIRDAGRWRAPVDLDAAGPEGKLAPDGRAVIAFASNDYLGLTQHPAVIAAAHAAIDRWGTGAGAARLIVGSRPVHSELEHALADWKRAEAAVLFPTGFAANLGVVTTFGGPGTLVCSDELNHASIIDGTRLAKGEVAVYPHSDLRALDELLHERGRDRRVLVVSDTVFSMDGDVADLDALVELCAYHGALLVLDEAHAVLGPELPPVPADTPGVLRVGTLSKTLGSLGGFVAGPRALTDLVVNRARSYIFTTAPTPADAAAATAALEVVRSSEGDELRARLWANVAALRPGHPSPIVPVLCGDEQRALAAAAALLEQGVLVPAIRPPTVPVGTSRLRVALSAADTPAQIELLREALVGLGLGVSTVFVAGTATEVGKTWWACATIALLREDGLAVSARKPAQSFAPEDLGTTDAELLGRASDESPEIVCVRHRWYEIPMAPPMAADALHRPAFTVADLVADLVPSPDARLVLVEGAGGPRSPIASDGDNVDLAAALDPAAVVLVGDAGLGTINAVRLSADALAPVAEAGGRLVVALNRYDESADLHRRNRGHLSRAGFRVVVTPDETAAVLRGIS